MKHFFSVIGVIFSILIVFGIVGIIYVANTGGHLDSDSKAYIDDVIPKIVS